MMDVDRRNEIIARRGAPATEAELQSVSDWLAEFFSRTRHGGDDERWAAQLGMTVPELAVRIDDLMRTEPNYPGRP